MTSTPASTPVAPPLTVRDVIATLASLRRLLGDANATEDVFRIVRTLNKPSIGRNYRRLLQTVEGGRIAFAHVELRPLLADPEWLARFAPGSVGAAYARFLVETGYSADGLAEISRRDDAAREAPHPYAWFSRRQRDIHDIWHVLSGYHADDPLGEACLVGFTYAQMGGAGWRLILLGALAKALMMRGGSRAVPPMIEGYRRGRRASWLPAEDYESLLAEPLEAARARLRIRPARRYARIRTAMAARSVTIASDGRVVAKSG